MANSTTTARASRTLNEVVGMGFGAVYLLVGLAGFAITGGTGFAATSGHRLLGIFMLNPLHNIVHLAVGALLMLGATKGALAARAVNSTVGAVYLLVGVVGLFALGQSFNILALNMADNGLHFASALVLLLVGVTAMGRRSAGANSLA